jgi:integrase/recombinase XerD
MSSKQKIRPRLSDEFRKALKLQDKSERTIKTYNNAVLAFVRFHNNLPPLRATVNHIRAFLFHLKEERRYAARTYNQFFYGLKAFFEIFLPDVPLMQSFCRMRTKATNITVITRHEFEAMIRHTTNLKHKALLEVLYGTGIRVNECAKIEFPDIDRKEMLLRVMGKGNKQRFTHLPKRALKTLQNYYRAYKPKKYLFEGRDNKPLTTTMIEYAIRQAAQKAGIKKKLLRIYCGTPLQLTF